MVFARPAVEEKALVSIEGEEGKRRQGKQTIAQESEDEGKIENNK